MKFLAFLFFATFLWSVFPEIETNADAKAVSFRTYIAKLQRNKNGGTFFSSCKMANGHEGILIFTLDEKSGEYFELQDGRTISSGQVNIVNGAYIMYANGPKAEEDKSKQVMKTLVMSSYFGLTAFQLDTITNVAPKQQCFE